MRVLVVEDDDLLADGLCQLLRGVGHVVDLAATGLDADSALTSREFDLVILDIGLPGMNGLDVLFGLRRRLNDVPVLLLTARDGIEDRVAGLDAGADDYLVKPFARRELEARIRALLRRRDGRKNARLVHGDLVLDRRARRAHMGLMNPRI